MLGAEQKHKLEQRAQCVIKTTVIYILFYKTPNKNSRATASAANPPNNIIFP